MNRQKFIKRLALYPYVTTAIFNTLAGSRKTIYNQLVRWIKDGDIIKLRRGLFTLSDEYRRVGLSKKLIANVLYQPSYISLEYALSYYGMIPEAVYAVTSVTTKKTQKFSNSFGEFFYKSIRKNCFTEYHIVKDEFGFDCLMASKEKALIDYFYFHTPSNEKIDAGYFEGSLRLQNAEGLDFTAMEKIARSVKSRKLVHIVKKLKKWTEDL